MFRKNRNNIKVQFPEIENHDDIAILPCPYMPEHKMSKDSLAKHLIRCKATNKSQFGICPYDNIHVIPKNELDQHIKFCKKKRDISSSSYFADQKLATQQYEYWMEADRRLFVGENRFLYNTHDYQYQDHKYQESEDSQYGYGYYNYYNYNQKYDYNCNQKLPEFFEQYYEDYADFPQRRKMKQAQNASYKPISKTSKNSCSNSAKNQSLIKQFKQLSQAEKPWHQRSRNQQTYEQNNSHIFKFNFQSSCESIKQQQIKCSPRLEKDARSLKDVSIKPMSNKSINKSQQSQNILQGLDQSIIELNQQKGSQLNKSCREDEDILMLINQIDKNMESKNKQETKFELNHIKPEIKQNRKNQQLKQTRLQQKKKQNQQQYQPLDANGRHIDKNKIHQHVPRNYWMRTTKF